MGGDAVTDRQFTLLMRRLEDLKTGQQQAGERLNRIESILADHSERLNRIETALAEAR